MMKGKTDHLKLVHNQNKKPGWKKAMRLAFRLVLLVVLLLLLKQGETYFRVDQIRVEGHGDLSGKEITAAGQIREGMSIFLLREQKAAERIKKELPAVKEVEIDRSLPDKVVIKVEKRTPAGYVMTADGFWVIDRSAVGYAYIEEPEEGYPLISGIDGSLVVPGEPLSCKARREALQSFFAAWPGGVWLTLERIDLSSAYNLVLHTSEDLEIWLGDETEIEHKLLLVQESLPYISISSAARLDVRCGRRLIVSGSAVSKDPEEVKR